MVQILWMGTCPMARHPLYSPWSTVSDQTAPARLVRQLLRVVVLLARDKNRSPSREMLGRATSVQNEQGRAMPANPVVNARPSATVSDHPVDAVYTPIRNAITVMARVGRNASMLASTALYAISRALTRYRTAEDLNVTSSKLARYERLLNDIFPLVSPDVRTMIDDVRQQVLDSSLPTGSDI